MSKELTTSKGAFQANASSYPIDDYRHVVVILMNSFFSWLTSCCRSFFCFLLKLTTKVDFFESRLSSLPTQDYNRIQPLFIVQQINILGLIKIPCKMICTRIDILVCDIKTFT